MSIQDIIKHILSDLRDALRTCAAAPDIARLSRYVGVIDSLPNEPDNAQLSILMAALKELAWSHIDNESEYNRRLGQLVVLERHMSYPCGFVTSHVDLTIRPVILQQVDLPEISHLY